MGRLSRSYWHVESFAIYTVFIMKISLSSVILICLAIGEVRGALKRCYKCRSRGELGDCRNPFLSDEQALQPDSHVDAIPCSSGWCAKVVENAGDFKERCSLTLRGHQQVFMCFCRGDLCNGQSPLK